MERVYANTINSSPSQPMKRINGWIQRLWEWLCLKRLEHDLRSSRSFQKYCEKIGCPNLAALEKKHEAVIDLKLRRKKQRREPIFAQTLQTLNLQIKNRK
ncbi:MAG: hypothetical protein JWM68_3636 [Verrucomicrobiales bacterium]|nr:hypothetical protein [Verrucomicrobiales bacterium]